MTALFRGESSSSSGVSGTDELLSRLGIRCARSLLAHFSLDSHSPRTVVKPKRRMQALLEARSRLAFHGRAVAARLGGVARSQLPQRQGGRGDPGTATLSARLASLTRSGRPHDRAGGYLRQDPVPCRASASFRRNQGGGPRRIRASGSGERKKAGESGRRCTSRRSFPFESSGVVSVF